MRLALSNIKRLLTLLRPKRPRPLQYYADWPARINDVCRCPDNASIVRHECAGKLIDGFQVMHNGLLVAVDGYYGTGITEMLKANRGCHEPQEELVFQEVISRLSDDAQMLEVGAYWAFYSMWFLKGREARNAWLIEPELDNIALGIKNFVRNGMTGSFTCAFIGEADSTSSGAPVMSVDSYCRARGIERLAILHADVQEAEIAMLEGARGMLSRKAIDYVFVSTHTEDLHRRCVSLLAGAGYRVEVSVTPAESFSYDGVAVAVRGDLAAAPLPQPSKRRDS